MSKVRCLIIGAIAPPLFNQLTPMCIPFGAVAIGSFLNQNKISCEVVSTAFPDSARRIAHALEHCTFLGISSMTGPYLKYALSVVAMAKRYRPRLPIVWGGPHASLMDDEILTSHLGDFVIRGVGEKSMLSLVTGDSVSAIPGLSYRSGTQIKRNKPDADFDINDFPPLDYSLLPNEYIDSMLRDSYQYLSSRGCPSNCSYCVAAKLYQRRWHDKKENKVVEELTEAYIKYAFRRIDFFDDNLFVDVPRLTRIIERLNGLNIHFKWRGFCRIDIFSKLSDAQIINLKERGLEWISFGAESGSQDTLDRLRKGTTVKGIKHTALTVKRLNIPADFSFMGGIPGESERDFYKTIGLLTWIKKNNPSLSIRLFKFMTYPEMPILEEHKEITKYLPKNIYGWSKITYQNAQFAWVPRKISNLLNVFSAASNYSEKPARFSIITILYYITQFRFKKKFFQFPVESLLVNKIHSMLTNFDHRKFHHMLGRLTRSFITKN
jgi:anaerobic magnesium-protoporphyrin IX monomethyl ester cyclase